MRSVQVSRFATRRGNDDGRLTPEEQPDDPFFQCVADRVGVVPVVAAWDWGGSTGYVENLRLALATREDSNAFYLRDIGLMKELIDSKQVVPLDNLPKNDAPKVYEYFGEDRWEPVRQSAPDGKVYCVPSSSPKIGVRSGFIRKDCLELVGMDIPKTVEWR